MAELTTKSKLRLSPAEILSKYGIYVLFVFLILILSVTNSKFFTATNFSNVLIQVSNYALLGVGMSFVIMTGGIDVSVGATMVVSASAYVVATQMYHLSEPVGLLILLLVSVLFGLINGVAIAYFDMPPFLVTLATQCIGRGLALVLTGGVSYRNLGASFTFIGKNSFLGLSLMVWVALLMFVIGYFLMHRTVYGRRIMAIGGNIQAARMSGIAVKKNIVSVYVLMGLIAGIAGFVTMARLGSFYASMGDGMEFMVIAAVVIGGTSMTGGEGSIIGTLVGTLIVGIINNALNLFSVSADWQGVAKGLVIFVAVMLDSARHKISGGKK